MNKKFSYSGPVTISHINARKEGPDDDKVLAVDLKLSLIAEATILDLFDDQLAGFFFTDINAVRNTMIGPIPFTSELEDYRLEAVGGTFFGVRVKKFNVKPMDGFMVEIGFQISFKPSGDEVARMAEFLQEEMQIRLEPANDELDLGVSESSGNISRMLREDGATATLSGPNGEVIATFNDSQDPLYSEARLIITTNRRASISLVQRHLKIGYNRAARLIERMEADGVVTAMDGKGAREVLVRA